MATVPVRARRPSLPSLPGGMRSLVQAFEANDLLTSASAIAFQVLTALVPFMLFAVGLLGFLNLEGVWRDEVAPNLRDNVSGPAYQVIDESVRRVLSSRQVFWVTIGFLLALWQMSGAVRAAMGAMNRVYGIRRQRSWRERMVVSTWIALADAACLIGAFAVVTVTPLLYGDVGALADALLLVVRWGVAAALMLLGVGVLVRYAPAARRPLRWVTFGTGLVVTGWVLMSILFVLYLREVADYGSVFGNLASVIILLSYLYLSAIVFLGGVQVDSLVRRDVRREPR